MQELDKTAKLEANFTSFTSSKLTDSQIIEALELLQKLFTKTKLFISPFIEAILQTLDFIRVDDNYVFQNPNPFDLINALAVIRNALDEVKEKDLPAEERAKRNEIRERQKALDAKFRKEKEEADKLKRLAQLDRKEKAQEQKPTDSVGNNLQFGAKTKCFKDIGIDLNKQRRG